MKEHVNILIDGTGSAYKITLSEPGSPLPSKEFLAITGAFDITICLPDGTRPNLMEMLGL